MTDKIRVTRRMCCDLRAALRTEARKEQSSWSKVQFEGFDRIEKLLTHEKENPTTRGGFTLYSTHWYDHREETFRILRDLMLVALAGCTQMQIRRAYKKLINALDEWSGTSAVESLGRIVELKAAS